MYLLTHRSETSEIYIGLYMGRTDSSLQWTDGTYYDENDGRTYKSWAPGEPVARTARTAQCTVLDPNQGFSWAAVTCNDARKILCETGECRSREVLPGMAKNIIGLGNCRKVEKLLPTAH